MKNLFIICLLSTMIVNPVIEEGTPDIMGQVIDVFYTQGDKHDTAEYICDTQVELAGSIK